jgi:rod shape-determining protein MreC
VLLVTDADFAAGVISQKNQTRGTLKGTGKDYCIVDYVTIADKVDVGEWYYTSGDDRIFPRGFPAGVVKSVHDGQPFKEIVVDPSGARRGLEDVLIILSGVHEQIPDTPPTNQAVYIAPPPPAPAGDAGASGATGSSAATGTEADRLRARYKAIGDAENHVFGEGLPGSKPPNFNIVLPAAGASGATGAIAPKRTATGEKGAGSATGATKPAPVDDNGAGAAPAPRKAPAASTGTKGVSGATGATAPTGGPGN